MDHNRHAVSGVGKVQHRTSSYKLAHNSLQDSASMDHNQHRLNCCLGNEGLQMPNHWQIFLDNILERMDYHTEA